MLPIWCSIRCHSCDATVAGRAVTGRNIPRREMMNDAIKNGWHVDSERAYCRKCCAKKTMDTAPKILGGYRNEFPLTAEHKKLPPPLQRRVGQHIKVTKVTSHTVRYVNELSGVGHEFRKVGDGEWKHHNSWTPHVY